MDLHTKLKILAKQKGWKLIDLHRVIVEIFGDRAITHFALSRFGRAHKRHHQKSIHQICSALGITKKELFKDTDQEIKTSNIKRRLSYTDQAYIEVLSPKEAKLQRSRLFLGYKERTKLLQGRANTEKAVYILQGTLDIYLASKHYTLHKDETLSFNASTPHQLENRQKKMMRCLVDQYRVG